MQTKALLKKLIIMIPTSLLLLNIAFAQDDYTESSADQTEYYENGDEAPQVPSEEYDDSYQAPSEEDDGSYQAPSEEDDGSYQAPSDEDSYSSPNADSSKKNTSKSTQMM